MTEYGYLALEGDLASAIAGLEGVERSARSQTVRGWANAGLAFMLLAARRSAEAEDAFARHPEPRSQPLLGLTLDVLRGRLAFTFSEALSECRYGTAAMGVARVLADLDRVEDVVRQAVEVGGAAGSRALLALQMGLHLNRDYEAAIRVGELVCKRQKWAISAYWLAVAHADGGDATATIAWLNRGADFGFSSVRTLDREPRFEPMRRLPGFLEARQRVAANRGRSADAAHGGLLWTGR
jgi:hypothetical protein